MKIEKNASSQKLKLLSLHQFSTPVSMTMQSIVSGKLDRFSQYRLRLCITSVLFCFVVCLVQIPALEMAMMVTTVTTLVMSKRQQGQKMNDIVIQTTQPSISEVAITHPMNAMI